MHISRTSDRDDLQFADRTITSGEPEVNNHCGQSIDRTVVARIISLRRRKQLTIRNGSTHDELECYPRDPPIHGTWETRRRREEACASYRWTRRKPQVLYLRASPCYITRSHIIYYVKLYCMGRLRPLRCMDYSSPSLFPIATTVVEALKREYSGTHCLYFLNADSGTIVFLQLQTIHLVLYHCSLELWWCATTYDGSSRGAEVLLVLRDVGDVWSSGCCFR